MGRRSRAGNLPADLTTFIGRRRELAEIKRALTATRLLTLTGSGGVGKTRLALRAAADLARGFPDGAWLVTLASIDDPLLITQAVFGALGLQDVSSRWSLSALGDHLRDRRLLLVLDNCEHLLDGVAGLAGTLLRSCPELRVLATSRHPLGMAGEARLRIPPLSLPDQDGGASPGQVAGSDAVALLVERGAAVQPGFSVDDSNAESVRQLCTRLDGMPLALELAAVRLEGLTVEQLLAGLDRELAVPAAALRGGEARQRTMEATLDWSHSLLSEEEQRTWARLSVFAGGFDAKAAATVCADLDASDDAFPELLAGLVESSIVQRNMIVEPPRYSMLETVRHYGRRKLRELGEEPLVQLRHRDWVHQLVGTAAVFDETQPRAFQAVHEDRDNVWSAMEFCRRQPGEAVVGQEICSMLINYWLARGPLRDVRRYLESLLPLLVSDSVSRARALIGIALFSNALDDPLSAGEMAQEALHIAERLADEDLAGWAAGALLFAEFVLQRSGRAAALSRTMLEAGRATGSPSMRAIAMHYTCLHWLVQGRVDEVVETGEAGVAICREAGDPFLRGMLLNSLAEARRRRGELTAAEALAGEGIECKRALDDRRGLAALIETLSWVASDRRDVVRAATLLGCAQGLRDSIAVPLLPPYVAHHAECARRTREVMGDGPFDRAFRAGLSLSVGDSVAYALGQSGREPARVPASSPTGLSRRELEIARMVAEGLTNREIADRLFISNRTVDTHVTNMLNKLGVNSRTQLARWVDLPPDPDGPSSQPRAR